MLLESCLPVQVLPQMFWFKTLHQTNFIFWSPKWGSGHVQEVMSRQDLSCGKGAMGNAQMVQRMSPCAKVDFCVWGNQWKLYCECCCFLFLQCHSSCTMCTLSPSLMTSRGPGCSFSLYQMRYPNRTAGVWHPHMLFPVGRSELDEIIFFPQKCIAGWMKSASINLIGCSLTFVFRVPNTNSGILLCCIVLGSSLLVFLMSLYLGLGSPLILDF